MVLNGPEKVLSFSKPNTIAKPPAMWQRQKQANRMGITPGTQRPRDHAVGTQFSVSRASLSSRGQASPTVTTLQLWRPKCSYSGPHLTYVPFPCPGPRTESVNLLPPWLIFSHQPLFSIQVAWPPAPSLPAHTELASLSSPKQTPQCPTLILLYCFLTRPELPAHLIHIRGARTDLPPGQGRLRPSFQPIIPQGFSHPCLWSHSAASSLFSLAWPQA